MKIIKLELLDFGKFHNHSIEFTEGMNIIYGDNEAGKSTIWHFIIGMFYGFYKPYTKRKVMLSTYSKYKPWRGGGYRGAIVIFDETMSRKVRILRDFEGNQSVICTDADTGEDITGLYTIHPVYKLPDVAAKHLGMSYTGFVNTYGISQMGHRTDDELLEEIRISVGNALSTKNLDIPMDKVFRVIKDKQDAIGSGRRKTSAYALKQKHIKALETERQEVIEIQSIVTTIQKELKELEIEEENLKQQERGLKDQHELLTFLRLKDVYDKGLAIQQELNKIDEEIKALDYNKAFPEKRVEEAFEAYKDSVIHEEQTNQCRNRLKQVQQELNQTKLQVDKLQAMLDSRSRKYSVSKVNEDLTQCHKDNQRLTALSSQKEMLSKDIMIEEHKCENEHKAFEKSRVQQKRIAYAIGLGFGLVGIVLFMVQWIIGLAVALVGLVSSIVIWRMADTKVLQLDSEALVHKLHNQSDAVENEIIELEENLTLCYENYQCKSLSELMTFKDQLIQEESTVSSQMEQYQELVKRMNNLEAKHSEEKQVLMQLEQRHESNQKQYFEVVDYYDILDLHGFKSILQKSEQTKNLEIKKNHLKNRLGDVLNQEPFDEFTQRFNVLRINLKTPWNGQVQAEELQDRIEASESLLKNRRIQYEKRVSELVTKEQESMAGRRLLTDIDEELELENDRLNSMADQVKVLAKVESVLVTITDELKHSFSPALNETISEVVKHATGSKYSEVKVNPDMEMRLTDPESGQIVTAADLSQGTMDIFYVGLRYALANWINANHQLPLIMDEVFAHLDSSRLKKALDYLSGLDNQMLLFTCQRRETQWATSKKSKQKIHVIEL